MAEFFFSPGRAINTSYEIRNPRLYTVYKEIQKFSLKHMKLMSQIILFNDFFSRFNYLGSFSVEIQLLLSII